MEDRADPAAQPERAPQSRSSAPRVRLSCEACRQRKVKCDKLSPCTSCVRLGFQCVPVERARLPRGRTRRQPERVAHTDRELADRVAKLEDLLRNTDVERSESSLQPKMEDVESWRNESSHPSTASSLPHRPRPEAAYIGSSFWESMMQTTSELRHVLDSWENEELETQNPPGFGGTSFLGSESSDSPKSPQLLRGITIAPQTRRCLCEIFLRNVDPVFKILHRPSVRAYLIDDEPYLDYEPDHQAPLTLAYAIYYAAVCTIDDGQCQVIFGVDKKTVSTELQRETEAALVKSDFVTTNDLTILQAYVLSLQQLAARSQDQSRRVWTMMSMALRVGQALCLHLGDPPFYVSSFDRQMRRRLWQAIGLLDLAASLDRASEPMMQSAWLDAHPPANINDEDIFFGMETPIQEHPEGTFTDMTHSLILAAAQSVARMLAFRDFIEPGKKTMALRKRILKDFQDKASALLKGCRPDLFAFQLYARRTAATINVPGDSLLRLAADNLQKLHESYSDPATAPWMWFGSLWVPWHGLAVALAELCVCKDPQTMTKYWPVVEQVFHRSSLGVADSQHGMLWKPLEKLMNQARNHKREMLGSQSPTEAPYHAPHMIPMTSVAQSMTGPLTSEELTAQLSSQDLNAPPGSASYTMSIDSTLAAGQSATPTVSQPQLTITLDMLEPYPNVWDGMDFTTTGLPASDDNIAWHNYESFIGDVYDNVNYMI
ncbi:uncharacterized protein N7477_009671 [Penicillium maclennaniae]|uniref:uncharacterized protein n=1 Tax=Penicillium maclennaniae TaxID=1343394 RepID=UPI00254030AB|nr:uncharacterized protein N7477_009671 [Penicillium maclennaniae]KAJ5662055.1 hypothetical protein N7477_009671 [Penicillium maclennaniae]